MVRKRRKSLKASSVVEGSGTFTVPQPDRTYRVSVVTDPQKIKELTEEVSLFAEKVKANRKRNCHDCGVPVGHPHKAGCDHEKCTVCGQQTLICGRCPGHDPQAAAHGNFDDQLAELWSEEFVDNWVQGCVLCERNSGMVKGRPCICPNGRAIKRQLAGRKK